MTTLQRVFIRNMKMAQLYVHSLDKLKISVPMLHLRKWSENQNFDSRDLFWYDFLLGI